MSFGISNLKKVLAPLLQVGEVVEKMKATEGAAKWSHLMLLADELMGLSSVEWSKLDDELKDLNATEREELLGWAKAKFDLENDKTEALVESALSASVKVYSLVDEVIKMVKDAKKA